MLRVRWEPLEFLETQIAKLDAQIQEQVRAYEKAIALCTSIPGIEEMTAAHLITEIGVNMDPFPSAWHMASGAGIYSGHYARAGKWLPGTPRKGKARLRRHLCQAEWAASHQGNLSGGAVSSPGSPQEKGMGARHGDRSCPCCLRIIIPVSSRAPLSGQSARHQPTNPAPRAS